MLVSGRAAASGDAQFHRSLRERTRPEKSTVSTNDKIGILTGGGDVPGLNPVIKSVVYGGSEIRKQVIGIRKGWGGLTYMASTEDATYIRELTRDNTRTIDRTGGTVLHTSRTNPRKVPESKLPKHLPKEQLKKLPFDGKTYDLTSLVLSNLEKLGIGCLVAIGGDDTLSFASVLSAAGFPVVAIPKTMDNDVQGTEYCIGFSTAVTRAKQSITRQRTTVGSHERIGIFRIFGRDAGFTALYTAYVTSTRCLIPEHPFDLDRVCGLLMEDKANNPSNYALVVVSEGAVWTQGQVKEYGEADAYGHKKKEDIGLALAEEVQKRTGQETMVSDLTYDLRSGEPDSIDQIVATTFANIAVELIRERLTGRMVGVQNGCYAHIPLPDLSLGARKVDVATLYNTDRYRPNYHSKLGAPLFFTGS
jgi:ATP-dependent phosphofructokinase / diphosphate-dependent phosphofructokinase